MLELSNVHSYYGDSHILQGISLSVHPGQCVSLLGRNGAGKSTTLKTILGFLQARPGEIIFRDTNISQLPTFKLVRLGLGYVPEDRGIFMTLSVQEHLMVAYTAAGRNSQRRKIDDIYDYFPRLRERRNQLGSQLSGGEQQMLSLARAMIPDPHLLILDEPSEGLAPIIIDQIEDVLLRIKQDGKAILLVEQNFGLAHALADYVYILNQGKIVFDGTPQALEDDEKIKHTYLGI